MPAPNIHSGVHQDLPQQLLFTLDGVMAEEGSHEGIHIVERAPLGVAAANLREMQGAGEAMFGHGLCRCLSVGSSDGSYDDNYDKAHAGPAEEPAKPDEKNTADNDTAADQPQASEAVEQQSEEPAAEEPAGNKANDEPAPPATRDANPSISSNQSSSDEGAGDSAAPTSDLSGTGDKDKQPRSKPDSDPDHWDVELLLPGAPP